MGTLADLLIPLAGSIGPERAAAMRKACDALEKRIEKLESATKHTGEGEEARGACGSGAFQPHPSRTEAASASAGDAREKVSDTHMPPSPASSVPAPATGEVPEWVPSADEIVRASWTVYDPDRAHPPGGLAIQCAEAVRRLIASRAPAAPVVDVERVVADAHHAFVTEASFPHIAQAIRKALAAQGIKCKEVQP